MSSNFVSDGGLHDDMAMGHQPWFGSKRPLGDNATSRAGTPLTGVGWAVLRLGVFCSGNSSSAA